MHIEAAEFVPDNLELTLFIQFQQAIRSRNYPLHITHIQSHTGLPGPFAQESEKIDQSLIGNVLKASNFHEKHNVNGKGLKKNFHPKK